MTQKHLKTHLKQQFLNINIKLLYHDTASIINN